MPAIRQSQVDVRSWGLKARITAYPLGHILHDYETEYLLYLHSVHIQCYYSNINILINIINPPDALTEEAKALLSKCLTVADMFSIIVHCYKKHFHFSFFFFFQEYKRVIIGQKVKNKNKVIHRGIEALAWKLNEPMSH